MFSAGDPEVAKLISNRCTTEQGYHVECGWHDNDEDDEVDDEDDDDGGETGFSGCVAILGSA